jgi:hypothetical protein
LTEHITNDKLRIAVACLIRLCERRSASNEIHDE